ncbi:MAG: AzlD domain-containing protein [Helicobacter sp.]|uniref:branched-chain amino acid transporter permease n=1 Tax=Helicobacter sp. TaxID=218 RepID=UPI0025C62E13|nr:AzlD domain-containing protein [Helicobacter sp.]MCH5313331.1 AzlD domain-containing protein [Helicobacter sp.]
MSPDEILHSIALVALIGLNTLLSRCLPFLIFAKSTPAYIIFLGKVLPSAIIAMLIVYCLKDMDLSQSPYGLNEIISVCVVTFVHLCLKIPAVSIICGTICYVMLVQSEILTHL